MKKFITLGVVFSFFATIPISVLAAETEGGDWGWIETIGRWTNLLILLGVVFYFTREPLKKFFLDRRQGIEEEIRASQASEAEADSQLDEMKRRVGVLDKELEELRCQAEAEAREERKRALELTEKEVEKVIQTAQREIGGLAKAARLELKAYAAELAVELARKRIETELDEQAQEQVVERFIVKLGKAEEERS